jgi:endonuclease YncB( thermonuclease family)
MLTNQRVRLKLETLEPRDAAGNLLAYIYINESENVSDSLIQAGWARADRSRDYTLGQMFRTAESAARKAKRGIWSAD